MQEINEQSNENGKVSEKPKDREVFRSLNKNSKYLEDDLQSTLYNPSRIEIKQYVESDLFLLRLGGPYYDTKITVGLSREQLEQTIGVLTEALTWAQIPKNTKVI